MKTIVDYIKNENSLEDIVSKYIAHLKKRGTIEAVQHASALRQYLNIRANNGFANEVTELGLNLHKSITAKNKVQVRTKSLKDYEEKILRNVKRGVSLDVLDTVGLRIIYFLPNEEEYIIELYKNIIKEIEFIISKGYILCTAENIQPDDELEEPSPNIIIPKEEDLQKIEGYSKYSFGMKDYILHPKKSEYQSVHVIFKNENGNSFEVQFRNFFMHKCSFDHNIYKKKKYMQTDLDIDPKDIKTPNFYIDEDGNIIDYDGVIKAICNLEISNI